MSRRSADQVTVAADTNGLTCDDIAALPDADACEKLFPDRGKHHSDYAHVDWDKVYRELAKVGVTLKLLHGEYRDARAETGTRAMGCDWHRPLGSRAHADAIMDRIAHPTTWITTGEVNMCEHAAQSRV